MIIKINQVDVTCVDIYAPDTEAFKYIQQILTDLIGKVGSKVIVVIVGILVGDFSSPLTMDRSSRQKMNKETVELNDPLDQMELSDIYRTFYPKAEYPFF